MYLGEILTKTIFEFSKNQERDYADGYGWMSIEEAIKKHLYKKEIKKIISYPGRSIDNYDREDYADKEQFSMFDLRSIVQKVQLFDSLCDGIIQSVIDMSENYDVVEKVACRIIKKKIPK
jgi:hypothetical protein